MAKLIFNNVDKATCEKMQSAVFGDNEHPIMFMEVNYKAKTQPVEAPGFLMLTNGAIYVFKKRLFGGASVRHHISPLQIITADHLNNKITLYLRDHPSNIDSDSCIAGVNLFKKNLNVSERKEDGKIKQPQDYFDITLRAAPKVIEAFGKVLFRLLDEILFKCKPLFHPILRSKTIKLKKIENPDNEALLELRAIMLSHYTFMAAKYLESSEYFLDKWKNNNKICLSKGFHPGKFAAAYATAIGWDYRLDTLCFNNAHFKYMNEFIDSLLLTSIFVEEIAFANYSRSSRIEFHLQNASNSNVKSWTFLSCPISFIDEFVEEAINAKYMPKRITFGKTSLEQNGIKHFFDKIQKLNELKSLRFVSVLCPNNAEILSNIKDKIIGLQEIELNHTGIDGSVILSTITSTPTKLRIIHITNEKFSERINDLTLPEDIEALDFSYSHFEGSTLIDLMNGIVSKKTISPIILKLRHLRMNDGDYKKLRHLNINENRNIKELDFSGNMINPTFSERFFMFLKNQHVTHIALNDISIKDFMHVLNHMNIKEKIGDRSFLNQLISLEISGSLAPSDYIAIFNRLILDGKSMKSIRIINTKSGKAFLPNETKELIETVQDLVLIFNIRCLKVEGFEFMYNDNEKESLSRAWNSLLNKHSEKTETIEDHMKLITDDIFGIKRERYILSRRAKHEEVEEEEEEEIGEEDMNEEEEGMLFIDNESDPDNDEKPLISNNDLIISSDNNEASDGKYDDFSFEFGSSDGGSFDDSDSSSDIFMTGSDDDINFDDF